MTIGQASSRRSLIKWLVSDVAGNIGPVIDNWNIWQYVLLLHGVVSPYIFILYMLFHLNVQDDNDDV